MTGFSKVDAVGASFDDPHLCRALMNFNFNRWHTCGERTSSPISMCIVLRILPVLVWRMDGAVDRM